MKFKIKFADQIVGTLSIFAIAALVFIIFFIGGKQKWFVPKHPYYTIMNSASSLSEGMGITYKGFTIGKLTKISLTEEDKVRIDFYISDEYIQKSTEGSIIELAVSPIGMGASIKFHPGVSSSIIEDSSFIPERTSAEAQKLIEEKKCIIVDTVDSMTSIVSTAMGLVKDIDELIKLLNDTISGNPNIPLANIIIQLQSTVNEVNAILSNVNTLTASLSDPQGLIPRLLESEETKGSIDRLFNTINTTISDVNGISTSLNDEMPQVSVLLAQLQIMLQQVQDVLEGVKNNPLIKGGVPTHLNGESSTPKSREENF